MLSRIGLGATEAPCFPSATRSVSDWFDVKDRGTPSGVYTSGAYIGPTLAPPILTGLMLAFNWRVMFIVMGLAGIAAAALWFLIYRDPRAQVLEPQDAEYLRAEPRSQIVGLAAPVDVAVPLSCHVGTDAWRVLHRLHHLDVPDLAAGLSGNAAAHQHRQDRIARLGAADLCVLRRAVRRLRVGPAGQTRHGPDRQPPYCR